MLCLKFFCRAYKVKVTCIYCARHFQLRSLHLLQAVRIEVDLRPGLLPHLKLVFACLP
jgi:hypothetical protein